MNLERGLLTKLIEEDGLNRVTREGIDSSFIEDTDCKTVFNYIERHYAEYKKVPSRSAVREVYPNFSFTEYTEPLEFFIDRLKEVFRRNLLEEALLEVNAVYSEDSKKAEEKLRSVLTKLSVTQKSFKDLNIIETADERLARYDEPLEKGILTNWSKIDYQTLGFHPEEFVVLVGEKYMGKSWLMIWMAYQAMLQGERVLFATKEMASEQLANRFDSIYSSIKYDSLRRKELSHIEEQRFRDSLSGIRHRSGIGSVTMARHSVNTVGDIERKAVEHDATIVFTDSVYLFSATEGGKDLSSETQRRMAISQSCKSIAQRIGIPFVASTQAGRRKSSKQEISLDTIEWSNAFSQDADTVILLARDDIDKELNRAWLHLLKCREGTETASAIEMNFEYMSFNEDTRATKEPSYDIKIEEDETSMFG